MNEKPKKTPKLITRSDGTVDKDEANKVSQELLAKLMVEQRAHEKDQSMHFAKTGKRDVVVHLAVTVLGSVDGHPIIGESDEEYNQWCFRINARSLPASNGAIIKAFSELAHAGKSAFIKLGMIRG